MRQARTRRIVFTLLMSAFALGSVSQLNAEMIFFANGRAMSVKDYRISGDMITVTLRNGGEATFSKALVTGVAPDEVPDETPVIETVTAWHAAVKPLDARPFATLIETVALKHGVDPALVHAVVQTESNYQPGATSHVGARGLMQLMPSTGRDMGVKVTRHLYDPETNLEAGVQYLKFLLERFNLTHAIAAYNAGPGNVQKYGGVPPFKETQQYVQKVLTNLRRQ